MVVRPRAVCVANRDKEIETEYRQVGMLLRVFFFWTDQWKDGGRFDYTPPDSWLLESLESS